AERIGGMAINSATGRGHRDAAGAGQLTVQIDVAQSSELNGARRSIIPRAANGPDRDGPGGAGGRAGRAQRGGARLIDGAAFDAAVRGELDGSMVERQSLVRVVDISPSEHRQSPIATG